MFGDRHRTRLFIDYHSFQLGWSARAGGRLCDWAALPAVLSGAAKEALTSDDAAPLEHTGTLFYAAVERGNVALQWWMRMTLGGQPGWRVAVHELRITPDQLLCPQCGDPGLLRTPAAPLTALTTDLVALAYEDAFDVAIVVGAAAELVPAVERVQEKGLRVVTANWRGHGEQLRASSWAGLDLDPLITPLSR